MEAFFMAIAYHLRKGLRTVGASSFAKMFSASMCIGVLLLCEIPICAEELTPKGHYMLLVSFYSSQINESNLNRTRTKIAPVINASPYHGIAVAGVDYKSKLGTKTLDWMTSTGIRKHIWPWVSLNRIFGFPAGKASAPGQEVFAGIKGIDVDDQTGAITDLLNIWEQSLATAKKMGSPGIVLDPEPYNDHGLYGVSYAMKATGLSEAAVIAALKKIGASMTDVANKTYPEATIWSLFCPLNEKWPRTTTYICIGLLERAKQTKSKLTFVAGGEVGLGYCHKNLSSLEEKIKTRDKNFAPYLQQYPVLKLGGTIAPWSHKGRKSGWTTEGECGISEFLDINAFRDVFLKLFRAYPYVWIYAAEKAGYDPFHPVETQPLNHALFNAYMRAKSE
jgi:hypothetical protein